MLSKRIKLSLKQKAHALKPVVMIGQKGITESLVEETKRSLYDHELIKVKISEADKDSRKAVANQLTKALDAEQINIIGNILVLYKKSNKFSQNDVK